MPIIPALTTVVANTTSVAAALWNTEFAKIRDAVNTYGLFTDVARTVTAQITFSVAPVFSSAQTFAQAVTVTTGGITVTGNSSITGTLTSLTGITSSGTAAFATVTVSTALTVSATATMRSIAFAADSTYDVGTNSVRPAVVYTDSLVTATITASGVAAVTGVVTGATIAPTSNGVYDIGLTGTRFANGYFTTGLHSANLTLATTGTVSGWPTAGDPGTPFSIWLEDDEIHFTNGSNAEYVLTGTPA